MYYIKHKIPMHFMFLSRRIPDLSANDSIFNQSDFYGRRICDTRLHYDLIPPKESLQKITKRVKICDALQLSLIDMLCYGGQILSRKYINTYIKSVFPAGYLVSLIPHITRLLEKCVIGEQFTDERHFLSLDKNSWISLYTSYQVAFDIRHSLYHVYEFHNMQKWINTTTVDQYKGERDVYKPVASLRPTTLFTIRYDLDADKVYEFYADFISDIITYDYGLYRRICKALAEFLLQERKKLMQDWFEIISRVRHVHSKRVNPLYSTSYWKQCNNEKPIKTG